jgi:hypothetical protein
VSVAPVKVRAVTSTDHLLALIRDTPDVADLLHSSFEFGIFRNEHGEAVRAASGASLEAIAGDWAGGTFFLCHDEDGRRPVMYASSEGQGGLIADDLKQALEIITGLAVWQDCLKFSGGGRLEAMEAAAVLLEEDRVSDEPATSNRESPSSTPPTTPGLLLTSPSPERLVHIPFTEGLLQVLAAELGGLRDRHVVRVGNIASSRDRGNTEEGRRQRGSPFRKRRCRFMQPILVPVPVPMRVKAPGPAWPRVCEAMAWPSA